MFVERFSIGQNRERGKDRFGSGLSPRVFFMDGLREVPTCSEKWFWMCWGVIDSDYRGEVCCCSPPSDDPINLPRAAYLP